MENVPSFVGQKADRFTFKFSISSFIDVQVTINSALKLKLFVSDKETRNAPQ